MIKQYLWMLPFFCFFLSYALAHYFFNLSQFPAPSITGKQLDEALTIISNHHLSARLLRHHPDADIPPGTVIDQVPAAGQTVKARQSLFLTISEPPCYPKAPETLGKSIVEIERLSHSLGIKVKKYLLRSFYPRGTCIGQIPAPGMPVPNALILYVAEHDQSAVIMPCFAQHTLEEVQQKLSLHHITPEILGVSYNEQSIVTKQRPLAGTTISLDTPPSIQLTT